MLGGCVWNAGPNLEAMASEAVVDRLLRTRWCRIENWLCRLRLKALTPNIPPPKSSRNKATRTKRPGDNHTIKPETKKKYSQHFCTFDTWNMNSNFWISELRMNHMWIKIESRLNHNWITIESRLNYNGIKIKSQLNQDWITACESNLITWKSRMNHMWIKNEFH